MTENNILSSPQPGPQTAFLSSSADIAIYGGAAGGGKSWAMLAEPLRHIGRKGFNAVIFRRNTTQIRNPGGLWDESFKLYSHCGGRALQNTLEWNFPNGSRIKFAHLEHASTVYDWQGSQICLICFDELTHFSSSQFFYLLSRNRSNCGVKPYIRATCNPDADSWLADLISWWIDPETGLALYERSAQLRYFLRIDDEIYWADTRAELINEFGPSSLPKSLTFINSSLYDNKILMQADPGYLANLKALPLMERERLLGANWKIRAAAGLYFQRSWINIVDEAPMDLETVRYWDLAATEKTNANNPDFTVGVKMGRDAAGRIFVLHGLSLRKSPYYVEQAILNMAAQDGREVLIGLPQDPGQAGKSQAQDFVRKLAGYQVKTRCESGDKLSRFGAFSAQCEAGNVYFLRGSWNEEFFNWLEGFPESSHDDHADAASGAYFMLAEQRRSMLFAPENLRVKADQIILAK